MTVVLDAAGLDEMSSPQPSERLRALLRAGTESGRTVCVPAVVIAECCRGLARTRAVERVLARRGAASPLEVVDTDTALAKAVGAVLHGAGSSDLAGAHVVAVAAQSPVALVVTSDPDDIVRLAATVPSTRVVTRSPT